MSTNTTGTRSANDVLRGTPAAAPKASKKDRKNKATPAAKPSPFIVAAPVLPTDSPATESQTAGAEGNQEPTAEGAAALPELPVLGGDRQEVQIDGEPVSDLAAAADGEEKLEAVSDSVKSTPLQMFAKTLTIHTENRIMTGGGECRFWNPLQGKEMTNGAAKKWVKIPVGARVHLISITETPDVAVVLVETSTVQLGILLRKAACGG